MKNKQEIEKLAEAALSSLDNLQPVDANEFLHAKVLNKMRMIEVNERKTYNRLMLKLSAALGIFICINGVSFYALKQQQHKTGKKATTGVAAFAEEYSLKNNSYSY